ncbi:hypothetical protein KR044_003987, partial [Drosophila immigrans]
YCFDFTFRSWLDYQPIGQRVPSTRFIAFKVPLRQNINETVDEQQRLAPHSLLESVPNLGLIVDLTNTNRYYNPQASATNVVATLLELIRNLYLYLQTFKDQNVEHQKLMIPGHHTPPRALAQRFCDYVTNFLEANADNDKLIGVHCTHGVNRTGYLICYFMITKMNMAPKLAIQTFADARGHQIERDNYTSSLLQLKKQEAEKTDQVWPRKFHKTKDDQHTKDERSSGGWRNDQSSWHQHLQQDQQQRQRREQRQEQKAARYQNQYQDRNYSHGRRKQQQQEQHQQPQPQHEQSQQYQQSWRGNEFRRYEPYNRKNTYNVSFNEKQANWQTRPPRPQWQRDQINQEHEQNSGYRRHKKNNWTVGNYSRNN